jgi:hypothetical protein
MSEGSSGLRSSPECGDLLQADGAASCARALFAGGGASRRRQQVRKKRELQPGKKLLTSQALTSLSGAARTAEQPRSVSTLHASAFCSELMQSMRSQTCSSVGVALTGHRVLTLAAAG